MLHLRPIYNQLIARAIPSVDSYMIHAAQGSTERALLDQVSQGLHQAKKALESLGANNHPEETDQIQYLRNLRQSTEQGISEGSLEWHARYKEINDQIFHLMDREGRRALAAAQETQWRRPSSFAPVEGISEGLHEWQTIKNREDNRFVGEKEKAP